MTFAILNAMSGNAFNRFFAVASTKALGITHCALDTVIGDLSTSKTGFRAWLLVIWEIIRVGSTSAQIAMEKFVRARELSAAHKKDGELFWSNILLCYSFYFIWKNAKSWCVKSGRMCGSICRCDPIRCANRPGGDTAAMLHMQNSPSASQTETAASSWIMPLSSILSQTSQLMYCTTAA